jgi:SAM-dependent methyltransferase
MRLEALWHDLECGAYAEDLPLWRALAAEARGPVLDVGAGTGRVSLDVAAGGVPVVALDTESELLEALQYRGAGLPVETVVADARDFALGRRFALVLVPMQTLQLLGGRAGRAAFLRCALDHLEPGGLLAAALADAMDCFDEEHDQPPPPDFREVEGVVYASRPIRVRDLGGRAAIDRVREIVAVDGSLRTLDNVVELDRLEPEELEEEAFAFGLRAEPQRRIPQTLEYVGSTVVMLRG